VSDPTVTLPWANRIDDGLPGTLRRCRRARCPREAGLSLIARNWSMILERNDRRAPPAQILMVTTFHNRPSGNGAFALVATARDCYAHRAIHSLGRHIATCAAVRGKLVSYRARSEKAAQDVIDEPVIRIASAQRPPESVFIDTSQPTIVPPPIPAESAIPDVPSPLQSSASMEPAPVMVGVDQKNLKKQNKTRVAVHKPPPVRTHVVAANSPPSPIPPTRLSFQDVVSGMGRKLFNLS
jgi:hypothetical protein